MEDHFSHGAARNKTTTLDTRFEIRFVERCYDACSRWYNHEFWTHVNGVPDDQLHLLDREQAVKDSVIEAHNPTQLYGERYKSAWFLRPCVNPDCALRNWEIIDCANDEYVRVQGANEPEFLTIRDSFPSQDHLKHLIRTDLTAMAQGNRDDLTMKCAACGWTRPLFKIIPIRRKWVYVLAGSGKNLRPDREIFVESDTQGRIHPRFTGGRFCDSPSISYTHGVQLQMEKWEKDTWHFFLSPVRLGPKSLELLCGSLQNEASWTAHVPVMGGLQPWASTAARRFHEQQLPTLYEYIPLVDPFAWADMAIEADYIPILDAQRILATNENELSKAFIAATLAQAIHPPRPDISAGKAPSVKLDPHDVEKMLQPPPKSRHYLNSASA